MKVVVGKVGDDFVVWQLKNFVKVMVINVILLFKIVKVVEDEVIKGIWVLEVIIEYIWQELVVFCFLELFVKIFILEDFI